MVPTREQVMAAYRSFWDKNLSCNSVATPTMATIIARDLYADSNGEFVPTDTNLSLIREHLIDEVYRGTIFHVKRGRAGGFYRSKGHMPVVGSSNQITLATGKDLERLVATYYRSLPVDSSAAPTPTQAPVAKQDPNSYSYLFLDEEGNQ